MSDLADESASALGAVTVLVVEDQDMVAEALSRALDSETDLHVVGVAGTVREAVAAAALLHPRVVVMDYGLPDGTGAEATRQVKAIAPEIDVVMMTGSSSGAVLAEALDAGCSGFVPKEAHFSELIAAIRGVIAGQVRVAPDLMSVLLAHLRPHPNALGSDLTPREVDVLHRLAEGESTSDIAGALFLSVHTVRNHIANLLNKLHARSRLEAVAIAIRHGLIEIPHDS
jgi:DNA-binding NarL/FixJ family response regulator